MVIYITKNKMIKEKKLLSEYRGFNKNIDLFENFPLIKDVYIVDFNMKDLKKLSILIMIIGIFFQMALLHL